MLWAWAADSACVCQVLWRLCSNISGGFGSLLAICTCSCISKWFYCASRAAGPFPSVWYGCLSVSLRLDCGVCTWQVIELVKATLHASLFFSSIPNQCVCCCWLVFLPLPGLFGPVLAILILVEIGAAVFLSASCITSHGTLVVTAYIPGPFGSSALLCCFSKSPCWLGVCVPILVSPCPACFL